MSRNRRNNPGKTMVKWNDNDFSEVAGRTISLILGAVNQGEGVFYGYMQTTSE